MNNLAHPESLRASVSKAFETPWKLQNELSRLAWLPWVRSYFAIHGVRWNRDWRIFGFPLIQRHRKSTIEIGPELKMRNWFSTNPLGVNHRTILATWSRNARIKIGRDVALTGTTICAENLISIGDHTMVGANCTIVDTDFHPIDPYLRFENPMDGISQSVLIEDHVFIGASVLILKGSIIGKGSVVGAGSVVAGIVPPGVIVAGNPAKVIRNLEERP